MKKKLKIALVHDQLNQAGGAERVLFALTDIFPQAPVYTLIYDRDRLKGFEHSNVKTTFIQQLPMGRSHFRWYLPLMPAAFEHLNLSGFDIVISSSSAMAKGVITGPNTIHLCYCHTPTRYLWSDTTDYCNSLSAPGLVKKILPFYLSKLRIWDQLAAQRVDQFIANSNFVAGRIKTYYRKDANVIYPPIDTDKYAPSNEIGDYYLMIGRLRPYKKFDLAIKAFNKLQIPLKIIGTGDELKTLQKMAGPHIEFLGAVDEETKRDLLSRCRAFINPQVEDFGITSVEAMAAGRPVIAFRDGGVTEQIIEGVTGEFFEDQTWESLLDKVLHFDPSAYNPQTIHNHAQQFNSSVFRNRILELVERLRPETRTNDELKHTNSCESLSTSAR